jgi:hypothetical protein
MQRLLVLLVVTSYLTLHLLSLTAGSYTETARVRAMMMGEVGDLRVWELDSLVRTQPRFDFPGLGSASPLYMLSVLAAA